MTLPYSLREGLAGFQRARFAAVAATSAMTVALVLVGLVALLSYQGRQLTSWLQQRVGEVEIMLADEIDDGLAETLHERARYTPGVAAAEYVSHEEALALFLEAFGEEGQIYDDPMLLPASIKAQVKPAYINPDSLAKLTAEFESWIRVEQALYNQPLLLKVQENLQSLTVAGLLLGIVVVIASLFLVANTVRLTIYARRLLIRTMKLVGATDAFVRKPFLVEGVVQGLVAGLLASGVLLGVYHLLTFYTPLPDLGGPAADATVIGTLISVGAGLGWLGSRLAVQRFIKNVALH